MKEKLVKNVLNHIAKCAKEIGKFQEDSFSQTLWCGCLERGIESPIEQILYCSIETVRELNYIGLGDPIEIGDREWFVEGLDIRPQYKIGNYRVDFMVSFGRYNKVKHKPQIENKLIVECDSQVFHERDEKERRYEKKRDRYLISKGYQVFHYTGAEIIKDSLEIAKEIIAHLQECSKEDLLMDSNFG